MIVSLNKEQKSKIWNKVIIKKLQNGPNSHDESIQNALFCVELQASPAFSWSAHQHEAWGCGAKWWWRWCRYFIHPTLTPEALWWSIKLIKLKIPVTLSIKINAIKPLPLQMLMFLLWLMWWTFCEMKWFDSSFCISIHVWLSVCLLFVCLSTHLFKFMIMFIFDDITTKETMGNCFINSWKGDLSNMVILQLFSFDLAPRLKALYLDGSHNHYKLGIILQIIKQPF